MTPALAVLAAVNVGVLWAVLRAAAKFLGILSGVPAPVNGGGCEECRSRIDDLQRQMRDLEDVVQRLPARWEDIKREARRLDGRARSTVARVRSELAESGVADERVETVADELGLFDDVGGEDEGVLPVRGEVAGAAGSGVPFVEDWERLALARKFAG